MLKVVIKAFPLVCSVTILFQQSMVLVLDSAYNCIHGSEVVSSTWALDSHDSFLPNTFSFLRNLSIHSPSIYLCLSIISIYHLSVSIYLSSLSIYLIYLFLLLIIVLYFALLEIEPRALHMLGKCSTTELYPQPYILHFYTSPWTHAHTLLSLLSLSFIFKCLL
jgi:hypothetical protein